ncbi:MAG: trimeric intracellular cation channel family protein [Gammaproteobacteria bacterium]|nr:trimeric intracellular cation channel family protein [Gammaproteobacteria bacterium]
MMDIFDYPALTTVMYWITLVAVAGSASSGVLEAGKKHFDLLGMIIVAIAAAIGGGTLRDVLLDRTVFWIRDQSYLLVAICAALLTFYLARKKHLSPKVFLIPDAVGLSLFAVAGTNAALLMDVPWLVASFMGVITGIMGGVFRDVLCNEEPLVFQGSLYATAAWVGALLYIWLRYKQVDIGLAAISASLLILIIRLSAIRWDIGLPKYQSRE